MQAAAEKRPMQALIAFFAAGLQIPAIAAFKPDGSQFPAIICAGINADTAIRFINIFGDCVAINDHFLEITTIIQKAAADPAQILCLLLLVLK